MALAQLMSGFKPSHDITNCGSVLSKVALGTELTMYISRDLAFFGKIRLDSRYNTCINTPILVLIHEHVLDIQNKYKTPLSLQIPLLCTCSSLHPKARTNM